jgi:hypothetical protein
MSPLGRLSPLSCFNIVFIAVSTARAESAIREEFVEKEVGPLLVEHSIRWPRLSLDRRAWQFRDSVLAS